MSHKRSGIGTSFSLFRRTRTALVREFCAFIPRLDVEWLCRVRPAASCSAAPGLFLVGSATNLVAPPASFPWCCAFTIEPNPHWLGSIFYVPGASPFSHSMRTILFANNLPACGPAAKHFCAFKSRLHPCLSRCMLTKLAVPLSSATFCALHVFLLIRRSHFLAPMPLTLPPYRLLRFPGNASLPPTVKHIVYCLAFLLRPAALPPVASALPSAVVFSASAKMKEKNQSSKEGQEKSS